MHLSHFLQEEVSLMSKPAHLLGSYAGRVEFWEPMITVELLDATKQESGGKWGLNRKQ